jgi:hypothetical protein
VSVGPFEGMFDVSSSEGRDTVAAFGPAASGGYELRVYAGGVPARALPAAEPYGRFMLLNDGARAVALYELLHPGPGGARLTGVFDYRKGAAVGRAYGHVSGAMKGVSPSSRFLATAYAKYTCGKPGEGCPPGTVVVTDLGPPA